MAHVHIVTSGSGGVLERLAKEITNRLDYVTHSTARDATADLQYYIPYSSFQSKLSPIEVAYFADAGVPEASRETFFNVAERIDHWVCPARRDAELFRDHGIDRVTTISPGVDLDHMRPMVKIGVVGCPDSAEQRGEGLIRAVLDTPGIAWHFTSQGWPGPALHIPQGEMGLFYNEMDYILVPALDEGGPICVVEALACGTKVIAPPVGWVPDFPHIEYRTGDAEDLRRVLQSVVAERWAMRDAVLSRTWAEWAAGHDRLFRSLLAAQDLTPAPVPAAEARRMGRIALILHGGEGSSLGGPSVRVPQTAKHLQELGYDVQTGVDPDPAIKSAAIVHGFNVWAPQSGVEMVRRVKTCGRPLVLSSIFLDLSERDLWHNQIPALFGRETDPDRIDRGLADLRENFRRDRAAGRVAIQGAPGHHEYVREMVETADHVILLAENERRALSAIGAHPKAATVVRNAVDPGRFGAADPRLFAEAFGLKDYIICVARLETRKNQLMLLHALRDVDIPIVLVGHGEDKVYLNLLHRHKRANVHFIGRIEPNDPLLPSAIAGARVFVLPSWSEGAPLAALEAGASGTPMVLSDRSSEQEYFGDRARYCDPSDPASIRAAVLELYERPRADETREELKAFVREHYGWSRYARETAEVYRRTLENFVPPSTAPAPAVAEPAPAIVLDLTTSCHHKGRWTGISRFEMSIAQALARRDDLKVHFVAWHEATRRFVPISPHAVTPDEIAIYHDFAGRTGLSVKVPPGARLIAGGTAWMQNSRYASGLVEFAQASGFSLTLLIHDIIPLLFPFWFEEGFAAQFARNLNLVLRGAAHVLAVSQNTKRDLESFSFQGAIETPPIGVIRGGGDISVPFRGAEQAAAQDAALAAKLSAQPFVLNVGAIEARKNHRFLYDLWCRLAERLGKNCPHLVIAGGVALNGGEVARAFREDKRVCDLVHILEDVSDATLSVLYEKALFTVYPSLYDGSAPTVAESLSRGKICIAANTSSIPEIAPALTDLIDLADVNGWLMRITLYVTSSFARSAREAQIRAEYRGRGWDEAVEGMLGEMDIVSATPVPRRRYVLGSRLSLSEDDPANVLFKASGWYPSEGWGAWTSAQFAELNIRLARPPEGSLVLGLVARPLVAPFSCEVFLDGVRLGRMLFVTGKPQFATFDVPERLVCGKTHVRIGLRSPKLLHVASVVKESKDERSVGIGLLQAVLAPAEDFVVADLGIDASLFADAIHVGEKYCFSGGQDRPRFFAKPMVFSDAWGWHDPAGAPAILLRSHDFSGDDLDLVLTVRAAATPDAPYSALVVDTEDGAVVGRLDARDSSLQTARIRIAGHRRHLGASREFQLVCGRSKSPAQLKIGGESAAFGIGFFAIGLVRADAAFEAPPVPRPAIAFDQPIAFGSDAAPGTFSARYLQPGFWYRPELGGVWSIERTGRLVLPLATVPPGDVLLEFVLNAHRPDPSAAFFVRFNISGGPVIEAKVDPGSLRVDVRVPHSAIKMRSAQPVIEVEIESEFGLSPYELAGIADDRRLGVFLHRLVVRDWQPIALETPLDLRMLSQVAQVTGLRPSRHWRTASAGLLLSEEEGALSVRLEASVPARLGAVLLSTAHAPVEVRYGVREGEWKTLTLHPGAISYVEETIAAGGDGDATLGFAAPSGALMVQQILVSRSDEFPLRETLRRALLVLPDGPAAPAVPGVPVLANCGGKPLPALSGSWHSIEDEGIWSRKAIGGLRLALPAEISGPLQLELTFRLFGDFRSGPVTAFVRVGAGPVHRISRANARTAVETFEIEHEAVDAAGGILEVVFLCEAGASPRSLGLSSDDRHLTFFLQSALLRQRGSAHADEPPLDGGGEDDPDGPVGDPPDG